MLQEAIWPDWQKDAARALAASLLIHVVAGLLIVPMWSSAPPSLPVVDSIPVILVAPDAALTDPRPVLRTPPALARLEPPAEAPVGLAAPLTHAAAILSGQALAEPRNRRAAADLPRLNPTERMIQLCNIEALEQVARVRWDFSPEMVDAHAIEELAITPGLIVADGAAVRSGDDWYRLRYRCRLAPGGASVTAFDFWTGDRLAPEKVEELGLAVGR